MSIKLSPPLTFVSLVSWKISRSIEHRQISPTLHILKNNCVFLRCSNVISSLLIQPSGSSGIGGLSNQNYNQNDKTVTYHVSIMNYSSLASVTTLVSMSFVLQI